MKEFIKERGIEYLFHFTDIDNLDSILTRGLLPIETLDRDNIPYNYNDEYRMDGRLDATCVSISFPNYKMFYRYRMETRKRYCVIEIDPSILYERECVFCIENAASTNEHRRSDDDKLGRRGIEQLFSNQGLRYELRLPKYFTTNPQAEVLIPGVIDISYIKGVYFDNNVRNYEIDSYIDKYDDLDIGFGYGEDLFSPRFDYNYWSNNSR